MKVVKPRQRSPPKEGCAMYNVRCRCGKIVCQVANLPEPPRIQSARKPADGPVAMILCRHCKTYVVLAVPAVSAVTYTQDPTEAERSLAL